MINEFKNILLAGIGSAAYTYEKASNLVDEMVQKGKITVNEGKELSEELKRTIDENKKSKNSSEEKQLTREDIISIFNELNFVNKDDLNDINNKIKSLEDKISQLEK
ncbi:phasin family protein [Clostridium botulinum]|uniref:phasin family protein n=1 Tax=Clostridium botulinum TaxID=1491 RepID=UPI003A80CDA5